MLGLTLKATALALFASSLAVAQNATAVATVPAVPAPYSSLDCDNPSDAVTVTVYDSNGDVLYEGSEKEACEHLELRDLCRRRTTKATCETEPLSVCVINNPDGTPKIDGHCRWTSAEVNGVEVDGGTCECIDAPAGIAAGPRWMLLSLLASLGGFFLLGLRSRG